MTSSPQWVVYGTGPEWESWVNRRDAILRKERCKRESERTAHDQSRTSNDILDDGEVETRSDDAADAGMWGGFRRKSNRCLGIWLTRRYHGPLPLRQRENMRRRKTRRPQKLQQKGDASSKGRKAYALSLRRFLG